MSRLFVPSRLSVVVLTYNEELNLGACLDSLEGLECDLFVVDSGSTDRTIQIARDHGAGLLTHPFESHARQWRWAIENAPLRGEWVLGIDADQRLSPKLRSDIAQALGSGGSHAEGIDGFYVVRRQVFRGRWIRHGGYYPKYLLKLFRRQAVKIDDQDLLDHHFYIEGHTRKLHGDLIEANRKEDDLEFWIAKHVRYARLHAEEELRRRGGSAAWPIRASLFGSPDERTVWLKRLWCRMPLFVRPFLYFFYRYVILLGFLDGKQGFIFHFLQGFWYRLLVDVQLDDLLRSVKTQSTARPRG